MPRGGNRPLLPWDRLSPSRQIALARANDPRVPPGWTYKSTNKPGRRLTWETMNELQRRAAYHRGDERVPPGWEPTYKQRTPNRSLKWDWNKLSDGYKYKLWTRKDPRVPVHYVPVKPNANAANVRGRPAIPWEELSPTQKYKLYKRKDPRVPADWNPVVPKRNKPPKAVSETIPKKRTALPVPNDALLQELKVSRAAGQPTNKLAAMFLKLAQRYALKPNFKYYSYVEDMVSEGALACINSWHKFDTEYKSPTGTGPNPFSFFTTVVHRAFMAYLAHEKEQRNIRDELLMEEGVQPSWTKQWSDDLV